MSQLCQYLVSSKIGPITFEKYEEALGQAQDEAMLNKGPVKIYRLFATVKAETSTSIEFNTRKD